MESYVDGNCLCNWDQEAALKKEMSRLSLLPPPPLDDFDDVSIHTAPEEMEFLYPDSTDSEPSGNTTDELPSDQKCLSMRRRRCNKWNQWI